MAVIDRVNRWGSSGKRVLIGPGELIGPAGDGIKGRFASVTRISGSVDFFEVSDGSGANEGTYVISVKPYSKDGFRASLNGIGRVALIRQLDGVNTPTAAAQCLAIKKPRDKQSPVTLGPVAIGTADRLFVAVERLDVSTIKYQIELDLVLDAITIGTQPDPASVTAPAGTTFTVAATTNDGGTLSYQWQLSTDAGSSYANITNGGVYSGATTATLTISDSTGLNGNRYRVQIASTGGSAAVTSEAVILSVG